MIITPQPKSPAMRDVITCRKAFWYLAGIVVQDHKRGWGEEST